MPLRVLTLNVWNNSGNWERRCSQIHAQIQELRPDLIGFQEVLSGGGVDQLEDMLAGLGFHSCFAGSMPFWGSGGGGGVQFGNALASRWPIAWHRNVALPTSSGELLGAPEGGAPERRAAILARIESPHGPLLLASTHLNYQPADSHSRESQAVALAEAVWEAHAALPAGGGDGGGARFPPIVCGDFNASSESSCIRFLRGEMSLRGRSTHFFDAYKFASEHDRASSARGDTWAFANRHTRAWLEPDARLDYVFVGVPDYLGRGLVEGSSVVCTEPDEEGFVASDHYGVLAVLRTTPMGQYVRVRKAMLASGLPPEEAKDAAASKL